MKFFIAFALIATVASAAYIKPVISNEAAEIQEIIAAINSPSTNPATAAALEQMLLDVLGVNPSPIAVGPAFIESPVSVGPAFIEHEPVSVGPAIVDFPLPDSSVIEASPVIIAPGPVAEATASAPLVQIIVNVIQAAVESVNPTPVIPSPVIVDDAITVDPVHVVDPAPVSPVQVVDVAPVSPVQVVDAAPVSPVQVVDVSPIQVVETAPVAPEPVIIGTPVLPSPAVVLPEELN